MNTAFYTPPPPRTSEGLSRFLKILPLAALLAAGAAHAAVTSFKVTGFQNTGSGCGDVQALIDVGGASGDRACVKYTIVQDSRTIELLKHSIPAGTGPGAKFGDSSEFLVLSPPIWHLFDPSQPFTLTWSAGDMSTYAFPNCGNTWSGTLNVSSCADPKIVPSVSPSGSAAAVPTLGEVGLLLSGIALAGAAAPALRRREKQGKRADTYK